MRRAHARLYDVLHSDKRLSLVFEYCDQVRVLALGLLSVAVAGSLPDAVAALPLT